MISLSKNKNLEMERDENYFNFKCGSKKMARTPLAINFVFHLAIVSTHPLLFSILSVLTSFFFIIST